MNFAIRSNFLGRSLVPLFLKFWSAYLYSLQRRPIVTKSFTSAFLNILQELISQALSSANKDAKRIFSTVFKMAANGFFVSGPLGHYLYAGLNSVFHDTSLKSTLGQLLGANLIIAPIQNLVYLTVMAIIAKRPIDRSIKHGFWPIMKATWCLFPVVQLIAVRWIPQSLWLPYFHTMSFIFGVYTNVQLKRKEEKEPQEKKRLTR